MNEEIQQHCEDSHFASAARLHRLAAALIALAVLCPMLGRAQVPAVHEQ